MKPDISDACIIAGLLLAVAGLWLLLPPGAVMAIAGVLLTLTGIGLARPTRKSPE